MGDDIRAFEEETNFNASRQDVLSHPIVCDRYNICALVSKGTLKNMKLGLLKSLCVKFELETPAKRVRSKAPYLSLPEQVVSSCSCSGSSDK